MKLEKIWSEYQSALKAFLIKRVPDRDDVDDLLQEVLIKTHDNMSSIRSNESVKSWLFQVANRAMMDFYRAKTKSGSLKEEDLWFGQEEPSIKGDFATCIAPFISVLPEENSSLLNAIDLQGKSQKEYAKQLGISYSTFKSRVQKSRNLLKDLFEDCCHLSVDSKGNLVDYVPKDGNCGDCGK